MKKSVRVICLLLAAIMLVQFAGCVGNPNAMDAIQPTQRTDALGNPLLPDGNPDDVTCKGGYSVSEGDFSATADTVVATLGSAELTNGQLQVYYRMAAAAYTGEDAPDLSKPLETQLCGKDGAAATWQQYFLEQALNMWKSRQALALGADVSGFDEAQKTFLEQLPQLTGEDAQLTAYARLLNISYIHFANQFDAIQPETGEETAKSDARAVDIRYIRLAADSTDANAIVDSFLAAYREEAEFARLATQYSLDEGSRRNGGLYAGLRQGWLKEELDTWSFDPVRVKGDYTVITDQDAVHIFYFRGAAPVGQADLEAEQICRQAEAMLVENLEANVMAVDYSAIRLAPLELYEQTDADLMYGFPEQEQYPEVPLMIQQDYPYSYYGPGRTVSSHGCGLTCFAMLATYLLDEEQSPADLGPRFASYSAPEGTARSLFSEAPAELGIGLASQTSSDEEAFAALKNGHLVVSLQKPGLFTQGGHYILLTKYQEDGKITVLDPNKYNYVRNSIREDGFANGFEEKYITAGARIYWIYEKKMLNDPACDRCGGEGADIFAQNYYCADCQKILTRLALYEQYCG